MTGKLILPLILFTSAVILAGCEPKPQPVNYGSDECAFCRMMITEAEFGSQIVNRQGRAHKFDSIECMTAYDITENNEDIHSKWVPDFLNTDKWLKAEEAVFLHSETLRSPMGLFLSAYADSASARKMRQEYGGRLVNYETIKEIVEREWLTE